MTSPLRSSRPAHQAVRLLFSGSANPIPFPLAFDQGKCGHSSKHEYTRNLVVRQRSLVTRQYSSVVGQYCVLDGRELPGVQLVQLYDDPRGGPQPLSTDKILPVLVGHPTMERGSCSQVRREPP